MDRVWPCPRRLLYSNNYEASIILSRVIHRRANQNPRTPQIPGGIFPPAYSISSSLRREWKCQPCSERRKFNCTGEYVGAETGNASGTVAKTIK